MNHDEMRECDILIMRLYIGPTQRPDPTKGGVAGRRVHFIRKGERICRSYLRIVSVSRASERLKASMKTRFRHNKQ